MVSLVRPRGRIVLVGLYKKPPAVDLFNTTLKEAELIGSRVYSDIDFEKAVNLIISGRLTVGPLVTHRLRLDDVSEGLRLIGDGKNAMKVVLSLSGNQTC
jgi:threonine dehydrogenase-like Zn-dependent dehydrogenase